MRSPTPLLLPAASAALALLAWSAGSASGLLPAAAVPSPGAVLRCFEEELLSGRLIRDVVASLFRVTAGLALAAALAVPIGLGLGHYRPASQALLPTINFLRSLSPLAWIPFAILWFGIGVTSSIFLIFLAAFCPLAVSVAAAVAHHERQAGHDELCLVEGQPGLRRCSLGRGDVGAGKRHGDAGVVELD